jgi:hypothetical protein
MKKILKISFLIFIILAIACKAKKNKEKIKLQENKTKTKTEQKHKFPTPPQGAKEKLIVEMHDTITVTLSNNKKYLDSLYKIPFIKEWYDYDSKKTTPKFKIPDDLSDLSYEELVLLRNKIFAINGYLFNNAYLREYFDYTDWYKPIFDVDSFKICLTQEEIQAVKKIWQEEEKRKKKAIITQNNLKFYNADLIVNKNQYDSLSDKIMEDLQKQNFSIVAEKRNLPFYVYEENSYSNIPHYITTDLLLYVLHKYSSYFLQKLDKNFLSQQLSKILYGSFSELLHLNQDDNKDAIDWAKTYVSIALYALGDSLISVPEQYQQIFETEKNNIKNIQGGANFIPNELVSYKELKPRGHYTRNDTLKKYFKCFKWISINGIDLNNDLQLKGLLTLAYVIKKDKNIYKIYKKYVSTIEKIAGQEDNLSLSDLIKLTNTSNLNNLLSKSNIQQIRTSLNNLNKKKIKIVFGKSYKTPEKNIKRVYFISSTYSISAYIFSKLVQVDYHQQGNVYVDSSKRAFPRSLDVPAVFGNKTAEKIILNEYKDAEKWPDYLPRLKKLQNEFANFSDWNNNYGYKSLQTALSASAQRNDYPDFMKTDAYKRKELSTTLASWTHIKHDLALYQEKPLAAESGDGGEGPPPPVYFCYVEPNIVFWQTSLKLIEWLKQFLSYVPEYKYTLTSIENLNKRFLEVSQKELKNEPTSTDDLQYIGGDIENILLDLFNTDHWPEREKSMAIIADVYSRMKNGQTTNLNVAVGPADDIYVVVPINGEYYITRGAVFSFYEFKGKIMNDEEWKNIIKQNKTPDRPEWIRHLIRKK